MKKTSYFKVLIYFVTSCLVFNTLSLAQIISRKSYGSPSANISYFLPKKLLTLDYTYTVKTLRTVTSKDGQPDQVINESFKSISIDDPITITEQMVIDKDNEYDIIFTKRTASTSAFALNFINAGMIKDLNSKNESIVPEIIEATGNIISTVIKVVTTLRPSISGFNKDSLSSTTKLLEVTKKINNKEIIEFDGSNRRFRFSVSNKELIELEENFDSTLYKVPSIQIDIKPLYKSSVDSAKNIAIPDQVSGIVYRKPNPHLLTLSLFNNDNIVKQKTIQKIINFPQVSSPAVAPVIEKNKNEEIEAKFDDNLNIVSFSRKRTSNAKRSLEAINKSLESVNGSVENLKKKIDEDNEKVEKEKEEKEKEEKTKQEEEELKNNPATLLQKDIDLMKLEKQALELQAELKKLKAESSSNDSNTTVGRRVSSSRARSIRRSN